MQSACLPQSCGLRRARSRIRCLTFSAIPVLLAVTTPAVAQTTTGKIQGRVTDAVTGEPIVGAQVRVLNSTLGNLTSDQGFYFINEVTAGLQSIEASFIGYRPLRLADERILAGQTTNINFELESTVVELQPITVEGERNPLVPRDQVSTKSILRGEAVDELPVDNVSKLVAIQPGAYEVNCEDPNELDGEFDSRCLSIRGGRPNEEALYVDGVLVRSFGTGAAQNLAVPTNSLEQADVIVGGFAAEFGEAQSGVVSYVTRTGGLRYSGSLEFQTDRLAPETWTTNLNRLETNFGGPLFGPVSFFLAGTLSGRSYYQNEGLPAFWVVDGIDLCPDLPQYEGLCTAGEPAVFRLPRSSAGAGGGAVDSVDLAAPAFTEWDSRAHPFQNRDTFLFTGNLNWQLPRGSRITLGYTRNRFQSYGRGANRSDLYRADNADGRLDTRDALTLGSFLTLVHSATQQMALDLRISYQADRLEEGALSGPWYTSHRNPPLGIQFGNLRFHVDRDIVRQGLTPLDPGLLELQAVRSGTLFEDSTAVYPNADGVLSARQTVDGIGANLRANPYASVAWWPIQGPANAGMQIRSEDRLQARAALDWQIGRFNRLKIGGEYMDIDLSRGEMWLYRGVPTVNLAFPSRIGAFLQNRLDVGDLVLEAGLRMDYVDPGVDVPRVPGFSGGSVPDSLQAGYVIWNTNAQQWVPKFEDAPCGGVTEENPAGTCLPNWIPATTKTEWSPRLGASFPVTPTSTFRLSYGRFVQTPAFFGGVSVITDPLAASQAGLWDAERDVELPSTRTFEFGYRQLIGRSLVLDISAFHKKQQQALAFRTLPYDDPKNPGFTVYRDVLTNLDFTEATGFEVRVDKAISDLFVGNLSYTYLDSRGTGWNPRSYLDLTSRATSNLAFQTGEPVNPPEVLLPLETARRHSLAFTGSLTFPDGYLHSGAVAPFLNDLGVFTILYARSGQRFTKLEELGRSRLAPPTSGSGAESSFGALEMPWQFGFDLRITKGFRLGSSLLLQAFVDWRNPLDIATTEYVFAETGSTTHEYARELAIDDYLADPSLDGDSEIRAFDIRAESPANPFNLYMLMRAEERFGNGDGVFTVEEQERVFGQEWDVENGEQALAPSNQSLRLGLRLAF